VGAHADALNSSDDYPKSLDDTGLLYTSFSEKASLSSCTSSLLDSGLGYKTGAYENDCCLVSQ
jgi:hypothetical protein